MDEPKKAAQEAAEGANEIAADLAIAAAMVGTAAWYTGAGAGVAGVLGIGSGAAWLISAVYGDFASDPPRYDYQIVARVTTRSIELPAVGNDANAPWNEFSRTLIETADAMATLVRSFERLAGARLDLRKPSADADLLARRITTQRQAIRHNAAAAKQRIQSFLKLQSRVNSAWRAYAEAVRAAAGTASVEERQRAVAKLWDEIMPTLQHALGDGERLEKFRSFMAEQASRTTFNIPDEVFGNRRSESMRNMGKQLAVFAGERTLTPLCHELDTRIVERRK